MAKEKVKSPLTWAREYFDLFGHIKKPEDHLVPPQEKLVYWRGDFYEWRDGAYEIDADIDEKIRNYVASGGVSPSQELINTVKYNLRGPIYFLEKRVLNTWRTDTVNIDTPVTAITMMNGILSFDDAGNTKFSAPTPDFFSVTKLPYKYDPKAICPLWEVFIEQVTNGDRALMDLLQQWTGYLFTPTNKHQVFLMCLGEAGMGKGTFVNVLMELVGKNNCSGISLRSFTNRFALYGTYGKLLNVAADVEEELNPKTEGLIKEWTGEDLLTFEQKYGKTFYAKATAKLMMSANSFPAFTDKSGGTWRRLLLAPFDRSNKGFIDPDLRDKFRGEMPGIFNWAMQGLAELKKNNKFTLPGNSKQIQEALQKEANPAGMFLRDNYVFYESSNTGAGSLDMYTAYVHWCGGHGYNHLSDKNFGKEVVRVFPQAKRQKIGPRGARKYIYCGIKLDIDAEIRQVGYY